MKKITIGHVVAALLGIITTMSIGLLVHRANHTAVPAEIIRDAREFAVKPEELLRFSTVEKSLHAKQTITPQDWEFYSQKVKTGEPHYRRTAARHLGFTRGTAFEEEATQMALELSKHPDALTRASSLISLRQFQHPEWRAIAQQLSSDPDSHVRKIASALLAKKS